MTMTVWAENEFGDAPLAKPLVKRLVTSVRISAARGDEAAVSGDDRMIDRPDTEAFTPEAI